MLGWNESAWFAMLVGAALKSTAVLGVAWLATFLLRGRSAAARHLVWTAAAAGVVALPFLSVSLPVLPVAPSGALASSVSVVFRTTASTGTNAAASLSSIRASAPSHGQSAPWSFDWRGGLMLLWGAGALAALAQMLGACAGMWRARRSAKPSPHRRFSTDLAQGLGIRQDVEVLETVAGAMPMTFGIWRPAVLLPPDASAWTEERRRIVLLHELAHVRRGDTATQLLARMALILNWWNPLAWKAWRELLKERERATDDMVLDSGARASDYAGHLLEVARSMQAAPALGWAAVAMARPSQLEGRLAAILDSRVPRQAAGRASALAAALVAVALVAPLAAVRAQDHAASIPPDVDATIRFGVAQKNPEMLEKPAATFETLSQWDSARKLLDAALAIRGEVSGQQSVDYGADLMRIGDLEKMRSHVKDAEAFYTKALEVLGDRPESAPALMYLGLRNMKDPEKAFDSFQRAELLDPSLSGRATMWMALIRERQQNPSEAETLYQSSLAAVKPNSADAENTLQLYARFLKQQGREEESKSPLNRAAAIRQEQTRQWRLQHPPAQPSANLARVGGDVKPPAVLSKLDPEYSEEARAAKYAGTVVVSVEIDPDGIARNIQVVKGLGLGLDEKAEEAIGKWRFKPATRNGVPLAVPAHVEVNFRLL